MQLLKLQKQLLQCRLLTAIGTACGVSLTLPLFFGERVFPKVPCIENLLFLQGSAEMALAIIFLAAICLSSIEHTARLASLAAALSGILLCLLDQIRFQPWLYLYLFLFAGFALIKWPSGNVQSAASVLGTLRITLAFIYVWSGIAKFNQVYFYQVFPWMTEHLTQRLHPALHDMVALLGLCSPAIEVLFGLGLLFARTRQVAAIGAISMHVFLLLLLGPAGLNFNHVVWPWNIVMLLMVAVLFLGGSIEASFDSIGKLKRPYIFGVYRVSAVVLFGILPSLSLIGLWDSYPSFALYSGKSLRGRAYLEGSQLSDLPLLLQGIAIKAGNSDQYYIRYVDWAYKELGVPGYPETRVLIAVSKELCRRAKFSSQLQFDFSAPQNLAPNASNRALLSCADL